MAFSFPTADSRTAARLGALHDVAQQRLLDLPQNHLLVLGD
jgi:hypothetical protein